MRGRMKRKSGGSNLAIVLFGLVVMPSVSWGIPPDDVMRAAGYSLAGATSATKRSILVNMFPCYVITYNLTGESVSLTIDPKTSEVLRLTARMGRSPNPTSDTAALTAEWARNTLLSLNPYKIRRGLVRIGEPNIVYDPDDCRYVVSFPRLDAAGHLFESFAAVLEYDHGISKVTGLDLEVFLPEPPVTTGTLIAEAQAVSNSLQALMAHRTEIFDYVPEKMTFDYIPESVTIGVVERNDFFGNTTTGTAVAYRILRFESRLTDLSHTGRYQRVKAHVYVDAFSGAPVAGYATKMALTRK